MDLFRPAEEKLAKSEELIKNGLIDYEDELERQEEARKAELLESGEEEDEEEQAKIEAPKVKGVSTKKIWKYRITDVNLIPRECMIPNEVMLGELARTTKGTIEISRIEFYEEKVIASESS